MMEEAETWYKRGNEMMTQERSEEALTAYDKATALDPGHVSSWNNKGIALFRLKRFQEAIDCYDKALAINPDHATRGITRQRHCVAWGRPFLTRQTRTGCRLQS